MVHSPTEGTGGTLTNTSPPSQEEGSPIRSLRESPIGTPTNPVPTKKISFDEQLNSIREMLQSETSNGERIEVRQEKKKHQHMVIAHAVSGMVGSLAAELILFPVDTVKLLVQTSMASDNRGFFGTFLHVLQTQGVQGLYKGVTVSVVKESIHSMNFWLFHGFLFKHFAKAADTSKTPTSQRLLLNLFAKQLNWICTVPFEVVSTVNQLAPDSPGFFVTALALYRQGGVGTFYRGLAVSLALAINPAIMNTMITSLLRLVAAYRMKVLGHDYRSSRNHGATVVGVATAISKFFATLGTYPLIRAKVLQQSSDTAGVWAVWRSILAAEGVAGLYRGVLAMSYKTICWNAMMMMFKHALGPKRIETPPMTPPKLDAAALVPPWMGRAPFPAEMITDEKLDEILSFMRGDRVSKIEKRMDHLSGEISDVKDLLVQLVQKVHTPQASPATQSLTARKNVQNPIDAPA